MGLTALVMAGGRGSRMGGLVEKPLLVIAGKSLLERMIETLKLSHSLERIVVATSPNTPLTTRKAERLNVENIVTPGDGFEEDMQFAIRQLALDDVVVVSCDLPFLTVDVIERAVETYRTSKKPALAVMTPVETYKKSGSTPSYVFDIQGQSLVPVGINIIDGRRIGEGQLEQVEMIINSEDIALNVNTLRDLETAKKIDADQRG
jgi:adenosylcobinamide-phosphate guanylyltransferase